MITLFKKSPAQEQQQKKQIVEVVEKNHDTFYTKVNRLLIYANQFNSLATGKQHIIDKCNIIVGIVLICCLLVVYVFAPLGEWFLS